MTASLAVALAFAAVVLMAGIAIGIAAVALLDWIVVWPRRSRRSPGAQYWVHSDYADTTPITVGGAR
ncbi:hypothetical protein [Glycomyces paridis]|uniref:Uncharacterized protein n=1 Tax=Glycomyces paridis TaxID=2126555 RepID=A0A4S8PCJ8_9ACTN|nr:hypothetical protein [Glycomyces paridis]THV25969.1 hypothetical protein E9998_19745 [Glycomyces paridis]